MEDLDFIKALDEYLDDEMIQEKIEEDIEEEKIKKNVKHDSNFTTEDTITISRFVNEFLGLQADCSNLYHSGLKDLNISLVVGVDNNFANKNPEYVKSGLLLLVIDAKGNRGTYINPKKLHEFFEKEEIDEEFKVFMKQRISDIRKVSDYYAKYNELKEKIELNESFYRFLVEARKVKKAKEAKEASIRK